MQFLTEYHLTGLVIGICTFLIIGVFHPVVIKAEYIIVRLLKRMIQTSKTL